jgi:hypothetical protein
MEGHLLDESPKHRHFTQAKGNWWIDNQRFIAVCMNEDSVNLLANQEVLVVFFSKSGRQVGLVLL